MLTSANDLYCWLKLPIRDSLNPDGTSGKLASSLLSAEDPDLETWRCFERSLGWKSRDLCSDLTAKAPASLANQYWNSGFRVTQHVHSWGLGAHPPSRDTMKTEVEEVHRHVPEKSGPLVTNWDVSCYLKYIYIYGGICSCSWDLSVLDHSTTSQRCMLKSVADRHQRLTFSELLLVRTLKLCLRTFKRDSYMGTKRPFWIHLKLCESVTDVCGSHS